MSSDMRDINVGDVCVITAQTWVIKEILDDNGYVHVMYPSQVKSVFYSEKAECILVLSKPTTWKFYAQGYINDMVKVLTPVGSVGYVNILSLRTLFDLMSFA